LHQQREQPTTLIEDATSMPTVEDMPLASRFLPFPYDQHVAAMCSLDDAAVLAEIVGINDAKAFHDCITKWSASMPDSLAPLFGNKGRQYLVQDAPAIGVLLQLGLQDGAPMCLQQFVHVMANRYAAYQEAGYREVGATRANASL
jgi:hypothetical protein